MKRVDHKHMLFDLLAVVIALLAAGCASATITSNRISHMVFTEDRV